MKKLLLTGLSLTGLAAAADVVVETVTVTETAVPQELETLSMFAGMPLIWWVAPLASIIALLVAMIFYRKMIAADEGNERMKEIAAYFDES